jgi:hypothetical protein
MNASNAKVGETYYTLGLNARCMQVICKVVLASITPADEYGQDCTVLTDGFEMKAKLSNLHIVREHVGQNHRSQP